MQPAGPSAHVIGRRATWLLASALSRPLYEHIRAPDGDECGLTGAMSHENSSWGLHPDTIWHLSPIFVWHSFFMSPRTAITRRISPFSAREGRPRGTENSDLGLIEKKYGKTWGKVPFCHAVRSHPVPPSESDASLVSARSPVREKTRYDGRLRRVDLASISALNGEATDRKTRRDRVV